MPWPWLWRVQAGKEQAAQVAWAQEEKAAAEEAESEGKEAAGEELNPSRARFAPSWPGIPRTSRSTPPEVPVKGLTLRARDETKQLPTASSHDLPPLRVYVKVPPDAPALGS